MTERTTDHPVEPLFLKRWSPRAFDASPIPETDLLCMFEAARWAPSAFNLQPWRFLYALRDDAHWQNHLGLLDDFNRSWAHRASALVFVISNTIMTQDNDTRPMRSHSFDTGAAWAQLALQATALGYHAHAMAGIDFDRTREVLKVPDHFHIEVGVAVGRISSPEDLPENLRQREKPSDRQPLPTIAIAGAFSS